MAEPFCYGPPSARIRGVHVPLSYGTSSVVTMTPKICEGCVNNCGGSCCYDLAAEAEDFEPGALYGEDFCKLYESYEHHYREHAGSDSGDY